MGIIGYMVTWRTYGTWADDDEYARGKCRGMLGQRAVSLSDDERMVVLQAIEDEAAREGETMMGIAVGKQHVHLVMRTTERPVGQFVAICKTVARQALREAGFEGKVWAKGYDKRFCFSEEELDSRIAYVVRHEAG